MRTNAKNTKTSDDVPFVLHHNGRTSVARGPGTEKEIAAFRNALQLQEFFITRETEESITFSRNIRIMAGDWPVRLILERQGKEVRLTTYLFIPWIWIISFSLFAIIALPFLSYRGTPMIFPIALAVVAFAIYKQRFDLRTDAGWQGDARTKWNGIVNRLLEQCFAGQSISNKPLPKSESE